MTTFEDAARAEAERYARTPGMNVGTVTDRLAEAYMAGAAGARDHLAEQEPTDAEVEAAKRAADDHFIVTEYYRDGEIRWVGCSTCNVEIADYDEQERHVARAALRAVARVRKEQGR